MIKGKFAAMVEIDISVDENTPGLLPFDELKSAVHNDTADVIKAMLDDEFSGIGVVKVTKILSDLRYTKEEIE